MSLWHLFLIFCGLFPWQALAETRIVTTEEPPANFLLSGKLSGTTIDIVTAILEKLDQNTEIELLPWARAFHIAKTTPNIVIFTAGKTQDRVEHGFHFIGPVISRKHSVWQKKGRGVLAKKDADIRAKNLLISGMRQDWRTKYFLERDLDVVQTNSFAGGLKMLLSGRVDFWISSDIEAPEILKELGADMNAIELSYVMKDAPSFIMLSANSSTIMIDKWRAAFEDLKAGDFFSKTAKKWSAILGYDVVYSDIKGFHKSP